MKTLGEIIESIQTNKGASTEDLVYSVLALSALGNFRSSAIMRLAKRERKKGIPTGLGSAQYEAEEMFRRDKAAFAKPPKEYVGWSNDPENPEYQKFHALALKLIDKVASKQNENL